MAVQFGDDGKVNDDNLLMANSISARLQTHLWTLLNLVSWALRCNKSSIDGARIRGKNEDEVGESSKRYKEKIGKITKKKKRGKITSHVPEEDNYTSVD